MITYFSYQEDGTDDRYRDNLAAVRAEINERIMIISGRSAAAGLLASHLAGKGYGIITLSPFANFKCFATGCPSLILIDCLGNCASITDHLRMSGRIPVICLTNRTCTAQLEDTEHFFIDEFSIKSGQIEALAIRIQYLLDRKKTVNPSKPGDFFVEYHKEERLTPNSQLSLVSAGTASAVPEGVKLNAIPEFEHKPNGTAADGVISVLVVSERNDLPGSLLPQLTNEKNINLAGDRIIKPDRFMGCLEQLKPKLLLLDTTLSHPPMSQWLRSIREKAPELKIILLCDSILLDWVNEIVEFGVSGCVLIDAQPQMVIKAINAVSEGELWLPRYVLMRVFKELLAKYASPGDGSDIDSSAFVRNVSMLTPQEKRIAELVAQGLTNKEIARQFAGSPETIKKHLQKIFEKLGINRRSQLATLQADERLLKRKGQAANKTIAA